MKKIALILSALALCAVMTACGESDTATADEATTQTVEATTQDTENTKKIQEYIDGKFKESLDKMNKAADGRGSVRAYVEEPGTMVLEFSLTDKLTDTQKSTFISQTDSFASANDEQKKSSLDQMNEEMGTTGVSLRILILDKDGKTIHDATYTY